LTFKPADPLKPLRKWTYQRVGKGFGNIRKSGAQDLQLRRCVVPFDPMTPAQISRRIAFAAAIAQWQTLTVEQKQSMAARARAHGLPIYGFFLSETLKGKTPLAYI
jgi:hypothetical protein